MAIEQLTHFITHPNYKERVRDSLRSSRAPEAIYTHKSHSLAWRIASAILSGVFLPLGLYRLLHQSYGRHILETPIRAKLLSVDFTRQRSASADDPAWKVMRIAVRVNGCAIDAILLTKPETVRNGRWLLMGNGFGDYYEMSGADSSLKRLLYHTNSNALFFNYPGVGASEGVLSRVTMRIVYEAMLRFLEERLHVKEIVCYDRFVGAAIQGEALARHKFLPGISYLSVKTQTFARLDNVVRQLGYRGCMPARIRALGWNFNLLKQSRELKIREVVVQSAAGREYPGSLDRQEDILNEWGWIDPKVSLAHGLWRQGGARLIGVPPEVAPGTSLITAAEYVAGVINEELATENV